jgi:hypothetical protein
LDLGPWFFPGPSFVLGPWSVPGSWTAFESSIRAAIFRAFLDGGHALGVRSFFVVEPRLVFPASVVLIRCLIRNPLVVFRRSFVVGPFVDVDSSVV